jgi:tetrahydromethanopterin S-methyltransferase subunit G
MSFYFEVSNLREEEQTQKICDEIDEIKRRLDNLENKK